MRQTDVRRASSLNAPYPRGRVIISYIVPYEYEVYYVALGTHKHIMNKTMKEYNKPGETFFGLGFMETFLSP